MDEYLKQFYIQIGERLSKIRVNVGFSKIGLAEVLRMDRKSIANAENGTFINMLLIGKLTYIYGLSISELIDHALPMPDFKEIAENVQGCLKKDFPDESHGIKINILITTSIKGLLDDSDFFEIERGTKDVNLAITEDGEEEPIDSSLISQILKNFTESNMLTVRKEGRKNYYRKP